MDVHVPRPITRGLRRSGIDVLTAQEDGTATWQDSALLDRATQLNRVLFSQDEDLLIEAANRQRSRIPFAGLIYAPQLALSIGQFVEELELLAKVANPGPRLSRAAAATTTGCVTLACCIILPRTRCGSGEPRSVIFRLLRSNFVMKEVVRVIFRD